MPLKATIVDRANDVPAGERARLEAACRSYNAPAWWRVHEEVPVAEIVGGEVDLRYLLVGEGDGSSLAAVCPLVHARRSEEFFGYSLRRFYFEHFFERQDGDRPGAEPDARSQRLERIAKGYGRVLRGLGCRMDDLLLATSPIAYGSGVATTDGTPPSRETWRAIAGGLQAEARRLRCPVLLPFVPPGVAALHEAGFREVFQCYDNRIPLDSYATFDDYLAEFSKSSRQNMRREMRRTQEQGIAFRAVDEADEVERLSERASELYTETSARHARRFPRFPPRYWPALKRSFGERLTFLVAERAGEVVGFHTLLACPATGDLCSHRMGRAYGKGLDEVPFYFEMCFYEPIRRALAAGLVGLRLGPGSENGKLRRRARQIPQHGYVWFPRRLDRLLFGRYMERFGGMLRQGIAKTTEQPLDVVDEAGERNAATPTGT